MKKSRQKSPCWSEFRAYRETLAVESVSVLQIAEKIMSLYHDKACTLSHDVLGTRLNQRYNEARLSALTKKQAKKKESKPVE